MAVRADFTKPLQLIGEPADYLPSNCSIESSDPSGLVTSSSELLQEMISVMGPDVLDNVAPGLNLFSELYQEMADITGPDVLHNVSPGLNHLSEISHDMINTMAPDVLHNVSPDLNHASEISHDMINTMAPDVLHNRSPYTLPGSAIEFNTSPYLDNSLDNLIDYICEPYSNSRDFDWSLFEADSASNLSERLYEIFNVSPNSQPN